MYDKMLLQIIPNKTTSHTNVLVNTLIKEVFTFNVASSGYILQYFKSLNFNQKNQQKQPTLNHQHTQLQKRSSTK
jgi:hypothetical protein